METIGSIDNLITVPEAASVVGVTEDAVRKAIQTGKLDAVRKFGRLLILPADLHAWDERRKLEIGRPRKGMAVTKGT